MVTTKTIPAIVILLLCAVNAQAQTLATRASHQTSEELRGELATAKDDILELRKNIEAENIRLDALEKALLLLSNALSNPEKNGEKVFKDVGNAIADMHQVINNLQLQIDTLRARQDAVQYR